MNFRTLARGLIVVYSIVFVVFLVAIAAPAGIARQDMAHGATAAHESSTAVPHDLSGWVVADGSSTIWPITANVAGAGCALLDDQDYRANQIELEAAIADAMGKGARETNHKGDDDDHLRL